MLQEKLAEVDMATYNVEQVKRPNQAPIFPDERRGLKYYVEERVSQAVAGLANTQVASTMNLEWTGALGTAKRQRQVSFTKSTGLLRNCEGCYWGHLSAWRISA